MRNPAAGVSPPVSVAPCMYVLTATTCTQPTMNNTAVNSIDDISYLEYSFGSSGSWPCPFPRRCIPPQSVMAKDDGAIPGESESTDGLIDQYRRYAFVEHSSTPV